MANNTIQALLRRGIDSITAGRLTTEGHTIESLKLKSIDQLLSLGLHKIQAQALLDESRPPIPEETFLQVVSASKWVCCVCRDVSKGIIIHHLKEWNLSRSHDFDNLALLCLTHHDEAHTSRELTLMLSPERIKASRDRWYKQVQQQDKLAIAGQVSAISEDSTINVVEVNNAQSFIEAIKSNVTIRLQSGRYNLSRIAKSVTNPHVVWKAVYNGYEPHIINVENVKIIGAEGAEIVIEPTYTWVLKFKNCKSVSIENIIAGHTTPGGCTGGVFMFQSCQEIEITKCVLYGCGTYGVTLRDVSTVIIHETVIKECTYGIMQIFNSNGILLRYCKLINCREFDLITIKENSYNINFLHCDISYNLIAYNDQFFFDIDETCRDIFVEYSEIYNNSVSCWSNFPSLIITRRNNFHSNRFAAPEDAWWSDDDDD